MKRPESIIERLGEINWTLYHESYKDEEHKKQLQDERESIWKEWGIIEEERCQN